MSFTLFDSQKPTNSNLAYEKKLEKLKSNLTEVKSAIYRLEKNPSRLYTKELNRQRARLQLTLIQLQQHMLSLESSDQANNFEA